jgi:hypothetical protein
MAVMTQTVDLQQSTAPTTGATMIHLSGVEKVYRTDRIETVALTAIDLTVRARVRNTGQRTGRHVVQAYLSRTDSTVDRPVRWLAGFATVTAEPDTEVSAEIRIDPLAFAHWAHGWQIETGVFQLHFGPHVDDLPLERTVTVTG